LKKNQREYSLSDLVIEEINVEIKKGVNKLEFEDRLHPIIKNHIKEWIK